MYLTVYSDAQHRYPGVELYQAVCFFPPPPLSFSTALSQCTTPACTASFQGPPRNRPLTLH